MRRDRRYYQLLLYLYCCLYCLFAVGLDALAVDDTWQADVYVSYLTGDYGEDDDTDMIYMPVAIKRFMPWGEISLTAPFIYINAPGSQIIVDGAPESVVDLEDGDTESNAGLGDMIFKVEYSLLDQAEWYPWVDAFAKIKLPTADEDKGLGTGEADVGFGVEMVKMFPDAYVGFLDISYTLIGSPSGVDYDNRFFFSPGIGRYYNRDLLIAAFYEWRQAIGSGDNPQLLSFLGYYKLNPRMRAYGVIDFGLSDGAADLGLTAGVNWRF